MVSIALGWEEKGGSSGLGTVWVIWGAHMSCVSLGGVFHRRARRLRGVGSCSKPYITTLVHDKPVASACGLHLGSSGLVLWPEAALEGLLSTPQPQAFIFPRCMSG